MIDFTWQLHRGLCLAKPLRFARIEFAEVNGFGDVRVGLAPIFADFIDQPRHELELALPQNVSGAEQQGHALFQRSSAPVLIGLQRGLHGGLNVFFAGFLVNANNFRRASGIERSDLLRRLHPVTANDQVVLAS